MPTIKRESSRPQLWTLSTVLLAWNNSLFYGGFWLMLILFEGARWSYNLLGFHWSRLFYEKLWTAATRYVFMLPSHLYCLWFNVFRATEDWHGSTDDRQMQKDTVR
jgi:hypothetical protein